MRNGKTEYLASAEIINLEDESISVTPLYGDSTIFGVSGARQPLTVRG
jgi:hypothetical protein